MHIIRTIFVGKKSLFVLIILGLSVVNVIWVIPTLRNTRVSASVFALTVAERIQSEISGSLGNSLNQIIGVSGEVADEPERTSITFQNLLRYHPIFTTVSLVNRSGKESVRVDSTGPLPPEQFIDQSKNTSFYLALQGRTTFTQPIILPNGEAHTTLVVPIPQKGEFIDEVIIAELNVENLLTIIQSLGIGHGHAYVLDRDGIEILHPDPAQVLKHQNRSSRRIVNKVLVDGAIADGLAEDDGYINDAGEDTFTVGMPIPVVKWGVFVEQPRSQALAGERQIIILAMVTSVLALIIFLVIALSISKLRGLAKQLQTVTENLYTQGAEIAGKNKIFSLLNKLYEISVSSLELKELATRVSKTIQTDLAFELVGLFLYDQLKEELIPIAFASSERLYKIQSDFNSFFESVTIPLSSSTFLQSIQNTQTGYTEEPGDVWGNLIAKEMVTEMRSEGHIKTSFAHLLMSRGKNIGVLIFSLNRPYDQLLQYENESIQSFVTVVAVAIDKALLNEELKKANDDKSEFISFASHEIRTPLTSIKGFSGNILDGDYGPINAQLKDAVQKILVRGNDAVALIGQYLNKSKMELGKIEYAFTQLNLADLVKQVVKSFEPSTEQAKLQMTFHAEESSSYLVNADEGKMKEVIGNLLNNAIKYTPTGSVDVSVSQKADKVLVSITDTGRGMSKATIADLFKKFSRGKERGAHAILGTGLGLYLAKTFVEAHNGRVWGESKGAEKGSSFFVELVGVGK